MASLPPIDVPTGATGKGSFDAPATGEPDAARFEYLLRLGDDSLILGQRLSEWCGHGPVLEVDLSLANLSLDLIGQATHLLEEAGRLLVETVESRPAEERFDPALLRERVRVELRRFFRKRAQRRPMVIPVVMEV